MTQKTEVGEPIYEVGQSIEFGSDATDRFVHDALLAFDYEWDPSKLRELSKSSLFMSTAEMIIRTPARFRRAHEHVLVKMYEAVRQELDR